ncbi:peptidoglycan editing factor PgeF [Megasphaera vaginalis (ex Srinivasan et al. 2021)]|uniref:Purine nucleoside phosphorylase n=1 Tax=Megasphaera vaginalis (ex Srinivasan et al. 2021) TaxID=1111454 RepID=U7UQW2_9FIRM|nr:peptidoglycan editing factor PgeF [Megasphaera vaginalis (ex Srinivasan et al. 2021)]ERT61710.1 YfiH family protein [Megasphaera vaginalis (ex Srinivasan et al. 2021)]
MIDEKNGISFTAFSIFSSVADLVAAVSTRCGGVSEGDFSTLNMSFSTGDEPWRIVENRRRFLTAVGVDPAAIISCSQVHGTNIVAVSEADCGRGAVDRNTAVAACDGLITDRTGVPLTMNFADCTPLLFYDPKRHVIALSHGGWRGAAANIAGCTVEAMCRDYGSSPADILAAIGPTIRQRSFEVGRDVIDGFTACFGAERTLSLAKDKGGGKYLFDLPGAHRLLLLDAGILPEHLDDCGLCTYERDDLFYSYRKSQGKTGRHMAVMELRCRKDRRE